MIQMFENLVGYVRMSEDLKVVLASLFMFLLFSAFLRFFELIVIVLFGRTI